MTEPLDTQEAEKAQAQRYVAELLKHSQIEDVTIEIDSVHVLIIKGRIYEEKEGRIVQLQALNEGRVDVAGVPYQIVSAVISKARYMAYDFCLAKADGTGEALKLLVDYVTVRRMVERKTAAFDPSYVDDLLERLNDMHEDAFTINGKEYYIAGEQWTQSIQGYRDLILIPVGQSHSRNVNMALPEALIEEMIETERTSICFPQPDGATPTVEPTPDPAGR